jgi:integrase
MSTRLTKRAIDLAVAPAAGQVFIWDSDLKGFGLRLTPGSKSFIVQTALNGQKKRVTIGRYGVITPEQARTKAKQLLAAMANGTDPSPSQQSRTVNLDTFGGLCDAYLKARAPHLKPRTVADYEAWRKRYLEPWDKRDPRSINRDAIELRHREITESHGEAAANQTMRLVRAVFNFAAEYSDQSGQSLFPDNPVRRLTAKRLWNRLDVRRNHIEPEHLPAFMAAVMAQHSTARLPDRGAWRDWLLLCLLSGLRRSEALTLRFTDVDMTTQTFTIPDPKNRRPHQLPMSDALKDLFERRRAIASPWVFASHTDPSKPLADPKKVLAEVSKVSGLSFTPHDLRRSFASYCTESGFPHMLTKRLMNHSASGDVTAGYVQFNQAALRQAMQAVTDFVLQHAKTTKAAIVQAAALDDPNKRKGGFY